jgi:cytochrome P450
MLFAGHATTQDLIAAGIVNLLRHPSQLDLLRAQPSLIGKAVEELLRFEGPIKILTRWVIDDLVLHDRRIEAGQRVFLVLAAANRDPRRFRDPGSLDIGRSPNPHIAFGRGPHTCVGAQLARIEARHAIGRVFERLPGLRLADQELQWQPVFAARSLVSVVVEHDA